MLEESSVSGAKVHFGILYRVLNNLIYKSVPGRLVPGTDFITSVGNKDLEPEGPQPQESHCEHTEAAHP